MPTEIRTRFAPSPTGYLHVGGARTALFNWLYAKGKGGKFVLRIEDTDQARNTKEAEDAILDGLHWLGLDWDEGPGAGGSHGPYYQSKRQESYIKWFEQLREQGKLYEDDGAWRFRFKRELMTFEDAICGTVTIDYRNESNTPDMVVRRSDGSFVFHFVNVVDDLEMQITDVIRGEDHLMNTAKHLQLFEAMGVAAPRYAHVPLLLNMDGSKMSKRDAGAALGDYPKRGFLPEAVFNFLALLGWSPKDDSEIMSRQELLTRFSLEGVNRAPAKFDIEKCRWFNQQHLLATRQEEFAEMAQTYASTMGIPTKERFAQAAALFHGKVSLLEDVPPASAFLLDENFDYDPQAVEKVHKNAEATGLLKALASKFATLENWDTAKDSIAETAKEHGAKPGQLLFPLRVALSGKGSGPDLADILAFLGRDECVRRLERFEP